MKLKIFLILVLCILSAGFSTVREIAFQQKVRLISAFDDSQDVISPYVYPQLAARDKQILTILTCYFTTTNGSSTKVCNVFKLSEIDSFAFRGQVFSLYNTKAVFRLYIITPGSGILKFTTQEYDLTSNRLAYFLISWTSTNWLIEPYTGTYKAIITCDLQRDGSASGAEAETVFKIF